VLKRGSRIVVPDNDASQSLLTSEFHNSMYAGNFGMARTRAAIGRMFLWKSLDNDVTEFVSICVICQRNKVRRHKPYGLLQLLQVLKKPWHTMAFKFIVKLSKTSRRNDRIFVFQVDKLTKMVLFVACKEVLFAKDFVKLYVDKVFHLHGQVVSLSQIVILVLRVCFRKE
jgi:hypothetical protein